MPVEPRCPGQDMRCWTPDAICMVPCPYCGNEIEFWKDEPVRRCSSCRKEVRHPRQDLGCAKWCKQGCVDLTEAAAKSESAANPDNPGRPVTPR